MKLIKIMKFANSMKSLIPTGDKVSDNITDTKRNKMKIKLIMFIVIAILTALGVVESDLIESFIED